MRAGRLQPLLAQLVKYLSAGWTLRGGRCGAVCEREEIGTRHRRAALRGQPRQWRIGGARRRQTSDLPSPLGHREALTFFDLTQISGEVLAKLADTDLIHVRHRST